MSHSVTLHFASARERAGLVWRSAMRRTISSSTRPIPVARTFPVARTSASARTFPLARTSGPSPSRQAAIRISLIGLLLAAPLGCESAPKREAIRMPPVASLRSAAEPMLAHVETVDRAPEWVNRERRQEGMIYGVGIAREEGRPDRDLYRAMREARESVSSYLVERGGIAVTPRGLYPPLPVDENAIGFERLAHDEKGRRWYALARLDVDAATRKLMKEVTQLNVRLASARVKLVDDSQETDDQVRAALAIIFALDRRQQYAARHNALTGEPLPDAQGLDDDSLQNRADDFLDAHGVRIVVEGDYIPGLHESIGGVLGSVHLRSDEFGRGVVTVRLSESNSFGAGYPYLQLDGHVEIAIEGGDARTFTEPIHIVSSGVDIDEARYRAGRSATHEVTEIVRRTLMKLAESGA